MRSGHIPRSTNVPFTELLDSETGLFKPTSEVRERFGQARC